MEIALFCFALHCFILFRFVAIVPPRSSLPPPLSSSSAAIFCFWPISICSPFYRARFFQKKKKTITRKKRMCHTVLCLDRRCSRWPSKRKISTLLHCAAASNLLLSSMENRFFILFNYLTVLARCASTKYVHSFVCGRCVALTIPFVLILIRIFVFFLSLVSFYISNGRSVAFSCCLVLVASDCFWFLWFFALLDSFLFRSFPF